MSDVSGIPYMGPMGQGNFFAPSFSYNPQMSAGQIQSSYMPEASQGQSVLNNLYGGGANAGFGQLTDYYAQQVANSYANINANYGGRLPSPGTFSDYNAGGAWPSSGGGGGISYQGGGYSSDNQNYNDSIFRAITGGGGGGGGGPSINWGNIGAAAGLGGGNVFDTGSAARYGADMFGGLAGGAGGSYQGPQQQMDFGSLFGRGVGGAQADPYPGMKMPGGLGLSMATPQQQPADYSSLFGRGVGGASQDTSSPYEAPKPSAGDLGGSMFGGLGGAGAGPSSSAIDWSKLFGGAAKTDPAPGMNMPGGLGTSMTAQEPAYDYGSLYGRGTAQPVETKNQGGFGSGTSEAQLFGTPPSGSLSQDSAFSYNTGTSKGQDTQGQSADTLAAQARARLADIIGSPETVKAVEEANKTTGRTAESAREAGGPVASDAATGDIPLPQPRPAGADAQTPTTQLYPGADTPRPTEDVFPARRLAPNGREPEGFVVHYTTGRPDPANVAADWQRNRPGVGSQYIMGRDGVVHDTLNEYGYGGINHFSPKYINSQEGRGLTNQNTVGMEISAKNDADMTDAQIASLQRFAARNYADTPFYGHGEMVSNREPDEGIRGSQAILQGRIDAGFPAPAPGATGTTPPVGFYDPVTGVRGPTAASPRADAGASLFSPVSYQPGASPEVLPQQVAGQSGGAENISDAARSELAQQLMQKYGPEALWAAQGQSQFPQGQTQPLGGDDVSRMPYTQQSPVPGASFPVQLYDDPKYGQASAPTAEAPPQPFPGASEVTQQSYQPARSDEGNPFFSPTGGSAFGFDPRGFGEGGYGNTFSPTQSAQQGPTMPSWQAEIPPAYRSPEVTAAIEAQARRFGIPPEAIPAVAGVEGSKWNPQYMTGTQAGVFQIAPDDFKTAGGTLGGLTYDQYRNATPAQQVAAYGDYINSSPNKAALDYAAGSNDPALAAALLQAIQFSPQNTEWADRLAAGDTTSRVTPKPQADELRSASIDAMRDAFAKRIAGFPQTQFLPGGQ